MIHWLGSNRSFGTQLDAGAGMGQIERFVLGVDLDGVVADFYAFMKTVAAEWTETPEDQLTDDFRYGLKEWGIPTTDEYKRLHRFALTRRDLFESQKLIKGAAPALRRLSVEGVRIRIITHRLFIGHAHQQAIQQTVRWLDHNGIPFWDLCFMAEKGDVGADLYIDDGPENIKKPKAANKQVIVFTNPTNIEYDYTPFERADTWVVVEDLVRVRYHKWCEEKNLAAPERGTKPTWDAD
jgi:5'(3')-deoxyribonucleotidase